MNRHPDAIPTRTHRAVPLASVETNGHAVVDDPKPRLEPVQASTERKSGIAQMFARMHPKKKEEAREKGDRIGKEEEKLKLSSETKTGIVALFGKHSSVASRRAEETTGEGASKEAAAEAEASTEVPEILTTASFLC